MYTKAISNISFQQLGLYMLIGLSTLFLLLVSGAVHADVLSNIVFWSCETAGIPTDVAHFIVDYNNQLFNSLTII